jgi:mannosyltransferase
VEVSTAPRLARPPATVLALAGVVALGAVLRFGWDGTQSYWHDEGITAYLVGLTPGHMLKLLPHSESTPPLYYCAAWVWARLFGVREAGLRSLSALAGTATVPVVYLIGRELASSRAALVAAALTAGSPLLVWYSQEARAYAALAFLAALSLLVLLRALRSPRAGWLVAWAAVGIAALATHYLAAVALVPEAVWLLWRHPRRAAAVTAVAAMIASGAALVPLAVTQLRTGHTGWIAKIPLGLRFRQLGAQFLAGFSQAPVLVAVSAAATAVALVLVVLGRHAERRAALRAAVLGVSPIALALLLVAAGRDEFLTRNVIVAWVPLALLVAVGMASTLAPRLGAAAALVACGAFVAADLRVDTARAVERPDWRAVGAFLGPAREPRVLALEHYGALVPLFIYQPGMTRVHGHHPARVRELVVVAPRTPRGRACWWGAACNLSSASITRRPIRGFRLERVARVPDFAVKRYGARAPVLVTPDLLARELGHVGDGAIILQGHGPAGTPSLGGS